jgi:hypothetical protein
VNHIYKRFLQQVFNRKVRKVKIYDDLLKTFQHRDLRGVLFFFSICLEFEAAEKNTAVERDRGPLEEEVERTTGHCQSGRKMQNVSVIQHTDMTSAGSSCCVGPQQFQLPVQLEGVGDCH